jgi:hypothetical protein
MVIEQPSAGQQMAMDVYGQQIESLVLVIINFLYMATTLASANAAMF